MKEGFLTFYGYIKRGFKKKSVSCYQSFHCQINWGLERTKADPTIKKGCQFEIFAITAVLSEKEGECEQTLISINRMDLPWGSSANPKDCEFY